MSHLTESHANKFFSERRLCGEVRLLSQTAGQVKKKSFSVVQIKDNPTCAVMKPVSS